MIEQLVAILQSIPAIGAFAGVLVGVAIVVALTAVFFGTGTAMVVMLGCLGILLLLALVWGIGAYIRRRRQAGFEKGMDAQLRTGGSRDIRDRWAKAMLELKKARLSMYSLPWYLLIGEPGSGKTTTLRQSGLEFPVGTEALSGTSGTRNCDWWFTNDAVILDTAGRWTFNELNAPDRAEWDEFLGMLKRHRRNCPINGVVVGIPCDSLLADDPARRREKAVNLRDKLTHLQRYLEVQFPVYILLMKADRILGFTEFYGRLPAGEDRQLFGWSNPDPLDKPYNPAEFPQHFRSLYERVHQWRLRLCGETAENAVDRFDGALRLAGVTDPVDTVYVFPEEFRAAGEALAEYVEVMFSENRFRESLFFRGFYFTSGLQQGQPILKACKELLRSSAAGEEAIEDLAKIFGRSRSLFIHDFYRNKVFPEKGLVARSNAAVARERRIRYAFYGGGGLLAAAAVIGMLFFAADVNRKLAPVRADLEDAQNWIKKDVKERPTRKPDEIAAHLNAQLRAVESGEITGGGSQIFIPTHSLTEIVGPVRAAHREFYSYHVLEPFLRGPEGVEPRLAEGVLADRDDAEARSRFTAALTEYIRWWRAALEDEPYFASVGADSLEHFIRYTALASNLGDSGREALKDRLLPSYKTLLEDKQNPYSPRPVLRAVQTRNITAAVDRLRDHWQRQIGKLRLKVPGLEEPERARADKLGALLDADRRLIELETTRVPLKTTQEYGKFQADWKDRYGKWRVAYHEFTSAESAYRTALEKHRSKLIPSAGQPGLLAQVREGYEQDYRALSAALEGKSPEPTPVRDQVQRDRAALAALLNTVAAPLLGPSIAEAKIAFRVSLGALKDAGVPADVLKKLDPLDKAGFPSEAELEERLGKLLTPGEIIRHGATILKHSRMPDRPAGGSTDGAAVAAGGIKNYAGNEYGRIAAAFELADGFLTSPTPDPETMLHTDLAAFQWVLPDKGWRAYEKGLVESYNGEILGRLHADGKFDKTLEPLGGTEAYSLLNKVRTVRLQSLATRAAAALLARAADPQDKAVKPFEAPVEAALKAADQLPAGIDTPAVDVSLGKLTVEPRMTRAFRVKLEEYLTAVEGFAQAYGAGAPVPMLDADRSSLELERRAAAKRREYRGDYVDLWRKMYDHVDKDLLARLREIPRWSDFHRRCDDDFGLQAISQDGLPGRIDRLVQVCQANLDPEADKNWLPAADREYLRKFGAALWREGYAQIRPAYHAFRDAVKKLEGGDAVAACTELIAKGEALQRPLAAMDKVLEDHPLLENCRPFQAVAAVARRGRELLTAEVNKRFAEEWAAATGKAAGIIGKFPFASDPAAPDAAAGEALDLLGRDSEIGRLRSKYEPMMETESRRGFPYVLRPTEADRAYVTAWKDWRDFLIDEKEPTVLRKFEPVKIVINETADVGKFAPESFLKQITRLRIKIGAQEEIRYDTSVPEKREFSRPFAPQQDFGLFELKYDSENADFINARQTVWPPHVPGAPARQPGAWVLLRYLREAGPTRTRTDDGRTWYVYHVMKDNADNKTYAFRLDLIFPAKIPGPFPTRTP